MGFAKLVEVDRGMEHGKKDWARSRRLEVKLWILFLFSDSRVWLVGLVVERAESPGISPQWRRQGPVRGAPSPSSGREQEIPTYVSEGFGAVGWHWGGC